MALAAARPCFGARRASVASAGLPTVTLPPATVNTRRPTLAQVGSGSHPRLAESDVRPERDRLGRSGVATTRRRQGGACLGRSRLLDTRLSGNTFVRRLPLLSVRAGRDVDRPPLPEISVRRARGHHARQSSARHSGARILVAAGVWAAVSCKSHSASAPHQLTIFPPAPQVQAGATLQLRADPASGPLQWSSSNSNIATVARGLVEGLQAGTVQIVATDGTDLGTTTLQVNPASVIPSLATNIQPIFQTYCVSCHTAPSPQEGIDLTNADSSFANLVGRPSPSLPFLVLVVPGDTGNSYLYALIRGLATINPSDNMPTGCSPGVPGSCIPGPLQQLVASWILTGANP
jgi:hypothetical protein